SVRLDWTVFCRQAAAYFEIERSIDKNTFTPVLTVTGREVINETESYNGIDDLAGTTENTFYYRLKTVSRNGRVSYSGIVTLSRQHSAIDARVLPNPVRGALKLEVKAITATNAQLYIVDATGKMLLQRNASVLPGINNLQFTEVAAFPQGMYILKLEMNGEIITRKFTVQK